MLQFFKDAALTRPVTPSSPTWILASRRGAIKRLSLWLADTWSTMASADAAQGATLLELDSVQGLPAAGSVFCLGAEIAYSSAAGKTLVVAPLPFPVPAGTRVVPKRLYSGETALTLFPMGQISARLKRPDQAQYGIPNTAALYPFSSAVSADVDGPVAIAQVDIEIAVPAGGPRELPSMRIASSLLCADAVSSIAEAADAEFRILRGSQGLPQRIRVVPTSRVVDPNRVGFVWGRYRWRDATEINAHPITGSNWDPDVNAIGREKFIAGIGDGNDLMPLAVEKSSHSLRARIRPGFYWTGPDRYCLPSDGIVSVVEDVFPEGGSISLGSVPRRQRPIFVGAFRMNHEGYYDASIRYEYMHAGFDPAGPEYQFTLDRKAAKIQLNKGFPLGRVFLGVAPDAPTALLDLPAHPVGTVTSVVLGAFGGDPETPVGAYSIDREAGTIRISFPNPSETAGRDLYVDCAPAVLVVFETGSDDSLVVPVDLNPAFSGITRGVLYLEHRKRRVASIQLSCDKPRMVSLPGHDTQTRYGPVFYGGDFALLQAVALSVAGDTVPGARLKIVPFGLFEGGVNYKDASQETVTVTTGGSGSASFIYTPPDPFGQYLAPSSVAGGVVSLPAPVPLEQLWNENEGWLARIYAVYNNDPVFGKIGAVPEYGESPWRQTGKAGTLSFRTNGKRVSITNGGAPVLPTAAQDAAGREHTDPLFDGFVTRLSYQAIPAGATIGSYFLAYVGRIVLAVQSEEEGVLSNSILLDLQAPPEIVDESGVAGYLVLDQGRTDTHRLGGAPIVISTVNLSRY